MNIEQHPIGKCYPSLLADEFVKLKESISKVGLLHSIVRYEGLILDGYHRALACHELGIEPQYEDPLIIDPYEYAAALNDRRRHLDQAQRAIVVGKLADFKRGNPTGANQYGNPSPGGISSCQNGNPSPGGISSCQNGNPSPGGISSCQNSVNQLAQKHGVGKSTAERGSAVVKKGIPELVGAVMEKKLSLKAAEKIARLPKEQQLEALTQEIAKPKPKRAPSIISSLKRDGFKSIKIGNKTGILSPDVSELEHEDRRKVEIGGSSLPEHKRRYDAWIRYRKHGVREKLIIVFEKYGFAEDLEFGIEYACADLKRWIEAKKQCGKSAAFNSEQIVKQ